jgi:hypothetical protein
VGRRPITRSASVIKSLRHTVEGFFYFSKRIIFFPIGFNNFKKEIQLMKKFSLWPVGLCAVIISFSAFAIKSLDDIAVGGVYHMILATGDEIEGIVESKSDTSLIVESKGTPYTFSNNLIIEYKLLEPPKDTSSKQDNGLFSYTELLEKQLVGADLEISITGGNKFRGTLVSIDNEYLKLNVNGSVIPMTKVVIERIAAANNKNASDSVAKPLNPVPEIYDTIILKNPETDEYGKPLANIVSVGKITRETNDAVYFTTKDKVSENYLYGRIIQIFRHTQGNPETELIRKYAMPLICMQGMMLVDIPPGKTGRPFFKVCIDKYEYPNKYGEKPLVNITYMQAQAMCIEQGKRLCTSQEWQWACSGLDGYTYSYGWTYDKEACNTGRVPEVSGNRSHCTGKFGAMDMVGNVFEWVTGIDAGPAAMGGPLSKCQAVSPGESGDARQQTGFRCCKSN